MGRKLAKTDEKRVYRAKYENLPYNWAPDLHCSSAPNYCSMWAYISRWRTSRGSRHASRDGTNLEAIHESREGTYPDTACADPEAACADPEVRAHRARRGAACRGTRVGRHVAAPLLGPEFLQGLLQCNQQLLETFDVCWR